MTRLDRIEAALAARHEEGRWCAHDDADEMWLVSQVRALREALLGLRYDPPLHPCWCLSDNKTVGHSAGCDQARAALAAVDAVEVDDG